MLTKECCAFSCHQLMNPCSEYVMLSCSESFTYVMHIAILVQPLLVCQTDKALDKLCTPYLNGATWWCGASLGGTLCDIINLILGLFLYHFLHMLSSWCHEPIHNNTNTKWTSPPWWWSRLPLQRRGFDDSMPPEGRAALHIYCPRPLSKDLNRFIKLK